MPASTDLHVKVAVEDEGQSAVRCDLSRDGSRRESERKKRRSGGNGTSSFHF